YTKLIALQSSLKVKLSNRQTVAGEDERLAFEWSLQERQRTLIRFLSMLSECIESKYALAIPVPIKGYRRLILKADLSTSASAKRVRDGASRGFVAFNNISGSILFAEPLIYVELSFWQRKTFEYDEVEREAISILYSLYSILPDDLDVVRERNLLL